MACVTLRDTNTITHTHKQEHSPDHICLSTDTHAVIHDKREEMRKVYWAHGDKLRKDNDNVPLPPTHSLHNGHAVIWKPPRRRFYLWAEVSLWNSREIVADDKSFYSPYARDTNNFRKELTSPKLVLNGSDYFLFTTGAGLEGHYGHYKHDVLPSIAYFRKTLPEKTMFLLLDVGINKETIEFIDPEFSRKRVHWIKFDQHVEVRGGTLTVSASPEIPFTRVHLLFNPLREWLNLNHAGVPPKRRVVYYKRIRVDKKGAQQGRVLDDGQEKELLSRVRKKMVQHNKEDLELVTFDGLDPATNETMSLQEQFDLFRSAQTIIGPHGTGLGGNLLWIDPSPKNCEDRTQLLEFVPGPDSGHVHHVGASHYPFYRGLPINYHVTLYESRSTHERTFVDLDMVDEFLDSVWGPQPTSATLPER